MEWGACSVSCGAGVQRRLRQCNKPLPANGGRHCAGSATDTRGCKGKPCPGTFCVPLWTLNQRNLKFCSSFKMFTTLMKLVPVVFFTVDGNWSDWSSWEECSRTCGQGNRTRVRTCSNPHAQHGGRACEGKAVEAIMCSIKPCPGTVNKTDCL